MKGISVKNLAQIKEANVSFGDFTVILGPQASGKSIFLQFLKLALDNRQIKRSVKQYGYNWNSWEDLLDLYFGEGMHNIWNPSTEVKLDNTQITPNQILNSRGRRRPDQLFYIPAQRVVTIQNGWPRNFMSFEALDPYVVKSFSENLRILMERGLGSGSKGAIFPQSGRMKQALKDMINKSIFFNGIVELDKSSPKKRFVLSVDNSHLPYMAWSAGQREFMPLLLGLYWLMPASKVSRKEDIEYVIIEEPEMGLHPLAIQSLLLVFFELMHRGYKVILSTHSPVVLELCWVIKNLQNLKASEDHLFDLFNIKKSPSIKSIFKDIIQEKEFKTYFFNRTQGKIEAVDISSLEPDSNNKLAANWGGLLNFSNRSSDLVSNLYAKEYGF